MTCPVTHHKISRGGFEGTLSALGEPGKKAIIEDLESRGTCHDGRYLELFDVCESLGRYFGVTSPDFTMRRVWMKVSKLCSEGTLTHTNRVTVA